MQSIPAFLISQAFSYSMLSHLMFNLMFSVPVPRLENPSNAYIMRYLKFFWTRISRFIFRAGFPSSPSMLTPRWRC